MIAIIAGMQRSGSTFSFNVARELLEARGGVSVFSTNAFDEALDASMNSNNLIIKTHAPDHFTNLLLKKNALPCICTIRKPEDAIASWMRTFEFSLEESVAAYEGWLAWHRQMSKHVLNIDYDEIERTPLLAVLKIGRYLLRDMKINEIIQIWWQFRKSTVYKKTQGLQRETHEIVDMGFSYYDKRTFFHRRHVSSLEMTSAHEFLTQQQIAFVRQELKEYVDVAGNYHW
ncbi:hypothetical protein [Candidatus Nitrotoga sp. AM1P]|uniref:hypothetical protein n=1 Tax=Candidatus Nitrotoga sp. AM1P TaxID=2559597 RepID=UPI0010B0C4BD|nr:hypothetical protein [Candidatus Nitrotoga sp. AM1P]BBJ22920.1 hypothetical protein W01_08470 [Candidatus Nitrotoga sp. AM1P]